MSSSSSSPAADEIQPQQGEGERSSAHLPTLREGVQSSDTSSSAAEQPQQQKRGSGRGGGGTEKSKSSSSKDKNSSNNKGTAGSGKEREPTTPKNLNSSSQRQRISSGSGSMTSSMSSIDSFEVSSSSLTSMRRSVSSDGGGMSSHNKTPTTAATSPSSPSPPSIARRTKSSSHNTSSSSASNHRTKNIKEQPEEGDDEDTTNNEDDDENDKEAVTAAAAASNKENDGDHKNAASSQNNDDDDDDESLPPPDEDDPSERLHRVMWRLPPEESHSDWTIVVTVAAPAGNDEAENDDDGEQQKASINEDDETKGKKSKKQATEMEYHIHRGILAAGPRKCPFFTDLFLQDSSKEDEEGEGQKDNQSKVTKIELQEMVIDAFPIMLDYMYDAKQSLQITSETATPLLYLSHIFDFHKLRADATHFWKQDIGYINYNTYYQHAVALNCYPILDALAKSCGKNILLVQPSSQFVMESAPEFWPTILDHIPPTTECSRHASKIVYHLIKMHASDLDVPVFDALTDEKRLPYIDVSVASHLLDAHDFFRDDDEEDDDDDDASVDYVLTSLQARCVEAIAQHWMRLANAPNNGRFLSRQKPLILTELLDQVLVFADKTVMENKRVIESMTKAASTSASSAAAVRRTKSSASTAATRDNNP